MSSEQAQDKARISNEIAESAGANGAQNAASTNVGPSMNRFRVSIRKIPDPGLASRVIAITGCT